LPDICFTNCFFNQCVVLVSHLKDLIMHKIGHKKCHFNLFDLIFLAKKLFRL
jgi:hypothetical protein